jgi:DNA-binding response OmpR family regulator
MASPEDYGESITALELGADDFVRKPFLPRELIARLRSLLRRNGFRDAAGKLQVGRILIDVQQHEVILDDTKVNLTPAEFRILKFLAEKPGHVRSRSEISLSAGGDHLDLLDRTIDAHIKNIRRKLGADADAIETVRGCGYRLRREDS